MRKRLFVRNWIRRLLRYLCIPVGFFLVVVPLYSLMIRQTIQAQSSSAMEMLAIGTTQLERCLSNIRSTTNKLFSETEYTLLASSYDNSILGDYQTLTRASKSLQDKTYDSSVITYSYITFERNGINWMTGARMKAIAIFTREHLSMRMCLRRNGMRRIRSM